MDITDASIDMDKSYKYDSEMADLVYSIIVETKNSKGEEMTQLISYKNDPKLKQMMVEEAQKHKKADAYIKGAYEQRNGIFRGCAVGCAIESINVRLGKSINNDSHKAYEKELGFPRWLAYLEDKLFENLPDDESKNFPLEMLEAIPVGVNLEPVKWQFCAYLLNENINIVLGLEIADGLKTQVVDAIRQCLAVHESAIKTGVWDAIAAQSVQSAARSAWSASAAASAAAHSAVQSAAWSAQSAQSAQSAESTLSASYTKYKNKLIELLKSTELVEEKNRK